MSTDVDLTGSVVVGYDGSAGAELALEWASDHARREGRRLVVLHATGSGVRARDPVPVVPVPTHDDLRDGTREQALLGDLAHRLGSSDLEVVTVSEHHGARTALTEASRQASVVVVGATGRGALETRLLGSVAQAVARDAHCPVVVVRHPVPPRPGSVLVGTDGRSVSEPAMAFAFRVAAARSWRLTVLHCFWDDVGAPGDIAPQDPAYDRQRERLGALARPHSARYPEVAVELTLSRGFADARLVQATHDHDLVVLGHHRLPFLESVVWGNVTPAVLGHAAGDVAVVPAHEPETERHPD